MAKSIADSAEGGAGFQGRQPAWSSATPITSKPTTCICAGASSGTSAAAKASRRRWNIFSGRWRSIRTMRRRYAGIADYHVSVASWGLEPPTEAWPKAKEAVSKALAADDSLAEAHASMGVIRMWYEWNWKEAEREFLRAIELKPGQPLPHVHYNLLLVQTGRFDEAEEQIRAGAGQRSALGSRQCLSRRRLSLSPRLRPFAGTGAPRAGPRSPTTSKRTS